MEDQIIMIANRLDWWHPPDIVSYSVTQGAHDRFIHAKEAIMPYELIMLLGFFVTALLPLLPEAQVKTATDKFHCGRRQRCGDQRQRAANGRRHKKGRATAQGGISQVPGGWPTTA